MQRLIPSMMDQLESAFGGTVENDRQVSLFAAPLHYAVLITEYF